MLPITVLTGFLGAGKTTLLRDLLEQPHGLRIALILNEMGQAGIDPEAAATARSLELTEGCVCCLRNPDLLAALDELSARDDVDRVILETTGLADPLSLTWTLSRAELRDKVQLDAVVTVVDPLNFERTKDEEEWQAQVRCADLVVLTKGDLASPEQLAAAEEVVRSIRPSARVLRDRAECGAAILFDGPPLRDPDAPPPEERPEARHAGFDVVSISGADRYRLDPLEDWLEDLPRPVFRVKGIVQDEAGKWVSFHVVGGRLQIEIDVPAPPHRESRMVLFGKGLEREALLARLGEMRLR